MNIHFLEPVTNVRGTNLSPAFIGPVVHAAQPEEFSTDVASNY